MSGREPSESWTSEDLRYFEGVRELEVAVPHGGKRLDGWTPIWVVVVDEGVFARTWRRRDTGWYGSAVQSGRTRIRVSGDSVDVIVAATGNVNAAAVDAAYQAKYGTAGSRSMVTAEAAASTLRFTRAS